MDKMKQENKYFIGGIVLIVLMIIGFMAINVNSGNGTQKVMFETSEGNFVIELNKNMPITTGNFVKLVNEGFYDGIIFHRVIEEFMIQGGDPQGTGTGGPGYTIQDEFVKGSSNIRGTISMANTGRPNSGGSQFFINLVDNTFLDWDKQPLTSKHPAFGKVIEGMDVIDKIGNVETGIGDKPVKDVVIVKAYLIK
jgi:peptidylprolyl isomerase